MYQTNLAANLVDTVSEDEHISVKQKLKREIDHEAMMRGYQMMADINLEMANEGLYAENEADEITSKFIGK